MIIRKEYIDYLIKFKDMELIKVVTGVRRCGKSTLFITGNISKLSSKAKYTFASVCASTPWVLSTTSIAPSQAAKLLLTS